MLTVETRQAAGSGLAALWWLIAGVLIGFGTVGILTVGLLLLVPGVAMVVTGVLLRPLRNQAAFLLLAGVAAAPGWIAWLHREGPGEVCHTAGDATHCTDLWSPWPFFAVAVLLAVAGTFLATRRDRR